MKLQYLGDAKDSFKWDYHDFLTSRLAYPKLNIALMMTPDDGGSHGQLKPSGFPARPEVISFCEGLRESGSLTNIETLPQLTKSSYRVHLHKGEMLFKNDQRFSYFKGFDGAENQVILLDPDNGFEPKSSCNEKHVRYSDLSWILEQVSDDSVVSVFQHFRRVSFPKDYARIKSRIEIGISTAIYWHSLMFVAVSKSEKAINTLRAANEEYARKYPVTMLP